ncbi:MULTISPECIES: TadE/TadG family type IV pilus assembly protein [Polaromonas]|uniref:TadE/TadG family type IV pilus assembly protein n=1 Tax=Polaromonas aquatica TaxID=332657 RepID=A0ABW1TTQ6_9BURK
MTRKKKAEEGARHHGSQSRSVKKTRGVVAIEFAFIFPAFFILFYAIITYGLIFAAQHTLALAAAEGGRAALRYPGGATDSLSMRQNNACAAALLPLGWLRNMGGLGAGSGCSASASAPGVYVKDDGCPYAPLLRCFTVTVRYAYQDHPMVPQLFGNFLRLPTPNALQGAAVVQVSAL